MVIKVTLCRLYLDCTKARLDHGVQMTDVCDNMHTGVEKCLMDKTKQSIVITGNLLGIDKRIKRLISECSLSTRMYV